MNPGHRVGRIRPPEDRVPEDTFEQCEDMDQAIRESRWLPPITAWHLAPQKARILPMLALSRSPGDAEVRQIFRTC